MSNEENMSAEELKNEGWKIDSGTRFLVYKENTPEEQVYDEIVRSVEYEVRHKLMHIYTMLGVDMWGSVGVDDLLDPTSWHE
tara:strand:- start:727 stop:972 length:246 start_codon:yes stop_codon:yes gene_type:complete